LSGSDANETNIKLVWYLQQRPRSRPEKKKIISRWRGYHGSGVMTGSLTGLELFHNLLRPAASAPVLHTDAPYYYRRADRDLDERGFADFSQHCADKLEETDPGRGAGDDRRLHRRADARHRRHRAATGRPTGPRSRRCSSRHDILLIADEVDHRLRPARQHVRLGSSTASKPDLITIAKGLTSAYAPLSGVIVSEKTLAAAWNRAPTSSAPIGHGWTYSSHPLCAAAGVANLELVDEPRPGATMPARSALISVCRAVKDAVGGLGHRRRGARRGPAGGGRVRPRPG
jgi:L-2,4-diaminobutyrate transaminase